MIRGGIIKTPNMEAESSSKPVPHSVVLQIGCKLVMMVTGPVLDQLPPALLSPPLVSILTHLFQLTVADHKIRIQQHSTPQINSMKLVPRSETASMSLE